MTGHNYSLHYGALTVTSDYTLRYEVKFYLVLSQPNKIT